MFMPFIQFTILEGRSLEQKERLIHEVSDLTAEILESPIENVRVHIQETSAEHWGIAGKSIKKRRRNEESK
jgi:4-oxalocrotonate tautomerase